MYSTCDDYYVLFIQVYNLVGVVRSHSDEEASMIEVEFHNTSTHHSFSLPNSSDYSMASLSEQALVLASEKQEEQSRLARLCACAPWPGRVMLFFPFIAKAICCTLPHCIVEHFQGYLISLLTLNRENCYLA